MTAPAWTVRLDAATTRLVRRYRGEKPADVVARAMRLLAQADGLLDAAGHPTTGEPEGASAFRPGVNPASRVAGHG